MSSGFNLPPHEHASFAVSSRLLSCLVTESLLRAFYLEAKQSATTAGILVILSTSVISEQPVITRALRPNDIFAIVPLRNAPVFNDPTPTKHGRIVGLVDPLDMIPEIYVLAETISSDPIRVGNLSVSSFVIGSIGSNTRLSDRTILARRFSRALSHPPGNSESSRPSKNRPTRRTSGTNLSKMSSSKTHSAKVSLGSSVAHWRGSVSSAQVYKYIAAHIYAWVLVASYENPPAIPSRDSHPIEWEQSLVAGHPTHPVCRSRSMVEYYANFF
jgi:hypothetical protein